MPASLVAPPASAEATLPRASQAHAADDTDRPAPLPAAVVAHAPPDGETDVETAAATRLHELVQRISRLSMKATGALQAWSVTLPMDEHAFPQTVLRIQASPAWMRLRFSTQSTQSVRLISKRLPVLQHMLEEALDLKHQLDIDFE